MAFSLFAHLSYASLPVNPVKDIRRVLSRFKLLGEQEVLVDLFSFIPSLTEDLDNALIVYSNLSAHWEIHHDLRPPEWIRRIVTACDPTQPS